MQVKIPIGEHDWRDGVCVGCEMRERRWMGEGCRVELGAVVLTSDSVRALRKAWPIEATTGFPTNLEGVES
jgi:hypothetical protein